MCRIHMLQTISRLSFQTLVKTFEVCDLPVRASKFVARKNWVITGAVSDIYLFLLGSQLRIKKLTNSKVLYVK